MSNRGVLHRAGALSLVLSLALVMVPGGTRAQRPLTSGLMDPLPPRNVVPADLESVTVEERLGDVLPLDLPLVDHEGRPVTLGDYFRKGRPVILNLGYYGCPMLCGLVLNGLTRGLKNLSFLPGREFDIVTVTIDPKEDTALARRKRESVLEELGREGAEAGWFFHTATEENIERLAEAVGFGYRWDPKSEQWAHAAVIVFASPEGKIVRYLYGIEFSPNDLKLALLDASEGKVGSTIDRILLYCFHYDPHAGGYVLFARNFMKVGGAVTLGALVSLILVLSRRPKKSRES